MEDKSGGLRDSIRDFENWLYERSSLKHELPQRMPRDSYLPSSTRV